MLNSPFTYKVVLLRHTRLRHLDEGRAARSAEVRKCGSLGEHPSPCPNLRRPPVRRSVRAASWRRKHTNTAWTRRHCTALRVAVAIDSLASWHLSAPAPPPSPPPRPPRSPPRPTQAHYLPSCGSRCSRSCPCRRISAQRSARAALCAMPLLPTAVQCGKHCSLRPASSPTPAAQRPTSVAFPGRPMLGNTGRSAKMNRGISPP